MSFLYLGGILLSAIGVGLIDARWRLALFARPRRALVAVFGTALMLLLIDLVGIATGNFLLGASSWMTGVEVLPHLPIEELAFVVFLSYVSLVAVTASSRFVRSRAERTATRDEGES